MFLTVGLGILATRWALQTLGVVEFGIFAGLVSTVGILLVISDGLGEAVERFLAFEIGRGDPQRQREFFGTALAIMLAAMVVVLLAGLPLGKLVIDVTIGGSPNVSAARAASPALFWAYASVLAGLGFQIGSVPFRSMFRAHQALALLTVIDTLESVLRLLAVVAAMTAPTGSDALLILCGATMLAQLATALAVTAFCMRLYPDARAGPRHFSRAALRELGSFAGWSILGTISYRLRMSGTPLLLLSAFGAVIAGAYAIAVQVAGYQLNISAAMGKAVQPAITQAAGRGDHASVRQLVPSLNKLATLLALFYLVPLVIETELVLDLWLMRGGRATTIAPETAPFVRLMLLIMGLPWLYSGYHAAIMADGRIRFYMLSAVIIEAIGLGVATLAATMLGAPPAAVPAIGLATACFAMCFWVAHISRLMEIPLREWLTKTWGPVLAVALPGIAGAMVVHMLMPRDWPRLLVVGITYGAIAAPLMWVFGLSEFEKPHIRRVAGAAAARVGLRLGGAPGA